jgi:hypothetical protein
MLRDAGILLRDFPGDLRGELRRLNEAFNTQYHMRVAATGKATFDYLLNPEFMIGEPPEQIRTRWSPAASGVIHACSRRGGVALARYAKSIDEIDDPAAMDFKFEVHAVTAHAGEVVVFQNDDGTRYGIVRIEHVLSRDRGDDRSELEFTFEVRRAGSRFD